METACENIQRWPNFVSSTEVNPFVQHLAKHILQHGFLHTQHPLVRNKTYFGCTISTWHKRKHTQKEKRTFTTSSRINTKDIVKLKHHEQKQYTSPRRKKEKKKDWMVNLEFQQIIFTNIECLYCVRALATPFSKVTYKCTSRICHGNKSYTPFQQRQFISAAIQTTQR